MPQVTKPKTPARKPPVTSGYEHGWDLKEVDSTYLVAELIRRGECPPLQPGNRQTGKPHTGKPVKVQKPSLFS